MAQYGDVIKTKSYCAIYLSRRWLTAICEGGGSLLHMFIQIRSKTTIIICHIIMFKFVYILFYRGLKYIRVKFHNNDRFFILFTWYYVYYNIIIIWILETILYLI